MILKKFLQEGKKIITIRDLISLGYKPYDAHVMMLKLSKKYNLPLVKISKVPALLLDKKIKHSKWFEKVL